MQYKKLFTAVLFFTGMALLCGCSTQKPQAATDATPTSPSNLVGYVTQTPDHSTGTGSETPVSQLPPTDTPTPTVTPTPTATPTPTPTPTPIPTVPPAPVALNTDIKNTYTFLVNREYPLSETYAPSDLVAPDIPFSFSDKTADKRKLRKVAADALEDLYHAALNEEGLKIYGVSGYRSYDRQYDIYGTNLINKGLRHTNLYSAAPGTSEHQTGLAIDVSCASIGYSLTDRFASTPEGIWLKENCWRFGFILRYPKEKESITGYAYEPWHIRYVGVPLAYYLHTTGLTLDEYYGTASRYTLTELATLPLIDTATDRFYNLYASVKGGALLYLADGTLSISAVSGYPHVILPITNAEGTVIKLDTTTLYLEPVYDALGNLMLTEEDTPYFKKPYFDAEGNLWLKYNNEPVFLDPLFRKDGTLAKDAEGNVLYTEPVTDGNGNVFITADGDILPKLPIRENGELTYDADGLVLFYEPFLDPETGEFFYDQNGLPFFSAEYYLALEEENSAPSEQPEEENTEQPIEPDASGLPEQPTEPDTPELPEQPSEPEQTEPSDEFGTEGYPVG